MELSDFPPGTIARAKGTTGPFLHVTGREGDWVTAYWIDDRERRKQRFAPDDLELAPLPPGPPQTT